MKSAFTRFLADFSKTWARNLGLILEIQKWIYCAVSVLGNLGEPKALVIRWSVCTGILCETRMELTVLKVIVAMNILQLYQRAGHLPSGTTR